MGCGATRVDPYCNRPQKDDKVVHVSCGGVPWGANCYQGQGRNNRKNQRLGPLALELEQLQWLNILLRQVVQDKQGAEGLRKTIAPVDPHLVGLAVTKEKTLQARRRAMEDVVDTLKEHVMHSIHTSDTLNAVESRMKVFCIGAAGDIVSTGEVNYDWDKFPMQPYGTMMLDYFFCKPGHLDCVNFGCCPKPVIDARSQWDIVNQNDPALWRFRSLMLRLNETMASLAYHVHADVSDLQYIINTSVGVSTVLKSQAWLPGDALLLLSCEFQRTKATAQVVADRHKLQIIIVDIPLPASDRVIISTVKSKLKELYHRGVNVKLACVPHVTPEGWTMPVKKLRRALHHYHIGILVDGTLAVGQFSVNIGNIAADYYVASLDRWTFAPKGVGFIAVSPLKQKVVFPLTVSYFSKQGYNKEFSYTGLQDFSTYLSVRQSLEFVEQVCGGFGRIESKCHALASQMVHVLEKMWGTKVMQMVHLRRRYHRLPVLPVPNGIGQSTDTAHKLMHHLAVQYNMHVFCFIAQYGTPTLCVRLAVQVFNTIDDAEALGRAVLDIHGRYSALPSVPSHILPHISAME